jgi:hypothetical protein
MKRYDAYKSTGIPWIPEVPEHWEVDKIRKHFKQRVEMVSDKDYPPLSVTKDGILPQLDTAVKTLYGDKRKLVLQGDYVVNSRSDRKGSCGISPFDGSVSLINIVMPSMDGEQGYYHLLFRSNDFIEEFYRNGRGIVADLWTTRYQEMKNIEIPFPPLSEQRAIVAYIERKGRQIDAYIARQAEQIERLKELRQTIISHAVTRGIHPYTRFRPTGIPWIPEVPEHWEVRKSTRIFPRIGSGTTPKTGVQGYYTEDNGIYWLQTGDLNDGLIEDTAKKITRRALDESNLNIYPIDSVVIAMYGATIGKVGLLNIESATNQACCVLSPSPHYISKYAISVFMSVKTELIRQALGGGQPNISQETIRRIRLPLPPLSEQRAIVAYIEKKTAVIDRKINACREQTELMKAYKQRLISDAVTGRINVLPHD